MSYHQSPHERPWVWIGQCTSCYRFSARTEVPKRIAMRLGPHCSWCSGHLKPHPTQDVALAAYILGGVDAVWVLPGNRHPAWGLPPL